jgi:hypothetical protein
MRSLLATMGLASEPMAVHEFESGRNLLFSPGAVGIGSMPNVVPPPFSSTRCARVGCDRPRGDPIHRLAEE